MDKRPLISDIYLLSSERRQGTAFASDGGRTSVLKPGDSLFNVVPAGRALLRSTAHVAVVAMLLGGFTVAIAYVVQLGTLKRGRLL